MSVCARQENDFWVIHLKYEPKTVSTPLDVGNANWRIMSQMFPLTSANHSLRQREGRENGRSLSHLNCCTEKSIDEVRGCVTHFLSALTQLRNEWIFSISYHIGIGFYESQNKNKPIFDEDFFVIGQNTRVKGDFGETSVRRVLDVLQSRWCHCSAHRL